MTNPELLNYIKNQKAKGKNDNEIKEALVNNGWEKEVVDVAFSSTIDSEETPIPSSQDINKLKDFGVLFKDAWNMFTKRVWTYFGIAVSPILVVLVFLIIGAIIYVSVGYNFNEQSVLSILGNTPILIFSAIFVLTGLLSVTVAQIWSQAALIYSIAHADSNIGIKDSFLKTRNKIFSFFWIGFLSGIIVFGGLILFIIPGILFAVYLVFAKYILIIENKKGLEAIGQSKNYIEDYWMGVFGRLVLFAIIIFLVTVLASIIPFVNILIRFFITPFALIFGYLIYKNLVQIKSGQKTGSKENNYTVFYVFIGIAVVAVILLTTLIPRFILSNINTGTEIHYKDYQTQNLNIKR